MIYTKPLGGLCNRMRALDSMFSLCKIYKTDLTVLWVQDASLNSPFEKIFEAPNFKEFNLKIINCPSGFPEKFPVFAKGSTRNRTLYSVIIRQTKNVLKFRFLSGELKFIRNRLDALMDKNVLNNNQLMEIYSSREFIESKTVREMDSVFIDKVSEKIKTLFDQAKKNDIYISSCYRLFHRENNYSHFIPILQLRQKILDTTFTFKNVIGLHIRRSDHITSKNYSTNQKFLELVEFLLKKDASTTFFLSTDDSKTKAELISKYGEGIITNEIASYDRNSPDAVRDAVRDLYCLAATKMVYGSHHSSFSQTAADIGEIQEITVK